MSRPLVAGEDSGDQFAEIVDLLGPPDPPMMEAMGVEDAVRKHETKDCPDDLMMMVRWLQQQWVW